MDAVEIFRLALKEDALFGDITTTSTVPNGRIRAVVLAKGEGIMAAEPLFGSVMQLFPPISIHQKVRDREKFGPGEILAEISGPAWDVLLIERTLLNILSRMCGIAHLTAEFVKRAGGVPVYDTRKTMPLLRYYDKYAVRAGGGYNHRLTLSEIAMIKDNHKRIAGSLREAVLKFRRERPHTPLIVEVESVEELVSLEGLRIDWVLLDNIPIVTLKEAVPLARRMGFKVEISGGITLQNVSEYASLKPDRISVGTLTKAALPVDISLEVVG